MQSLLRFVSSIVFRLPGHAAWKLYEFAQAEQNSLLTLRIAASKTSDLRRRALYLKHATDEARHARMFLTAAHSRPRGDRVPRSVRVDVEDLFEILGEKLFLAFVHHGERRGKLRFELYRDLFARRGDRSSAALFSTILADEDEHQRYTWTELVAVAGSERAAHKAILQARAWEAWRAFRRVGRRMAHALYVPLVLLVYGAMFPIALLTRWFRPVKTGFRAGSDREPA